MYLKAEFYTTRRFAIVEKNVAKTGSEEVFCFHDAAGSTFSEHGCDTDDKGNNKSENGHLMSLS